MEKFITTLASFASGPNAKKAQAIIATAKEIDVADLDDDLKRLLQAVSKNCRLIKGLLVERDDLSGEVEKVYSEVIEAFQNKNCPDSLLEDLENLYNFFLVPEKTEEDSQETPQEAPASEAVDDLEELPELDIFSNEEDDSERLETLDDEPFEESSPLPAASSQDLSDFLEYVTPVTVAFEKKIKPSFRKIRTALELSGQTADGDSLRKIQTALKELQDLQELTRLFSQAVRTGDYVSLSSRLEKTEEDSLSCPLETVDLFGWEGDAFAVTPEEIVKVLKITRREKQIVEKSNGFRPNEFPQLLEALYVAFRKRIPEISKQEFSNLTFPLIEKPATISKGGYPQESPFIILLWVAGRGGVIFADFYQKTNTMNLDWISRNEPPILGELTSTQGTIYTLITFESLVRNLPKASGASKSESDFVTRLKATFESVIENLKKK